MERGVDCALFRPDRRNRGAGPFVIGYVGRLSPEKNVRAFAALDEALENAGLSNRKFVLVGDGSERDWLARNVRHVHLPGVLRGDALAEAYANMDVFVFPSETDTFGNVVLEAMASGVPVIVTPHGGPRFLVEHGKTGFIAPDSAGAAEAVLKMRRTPDLLKSMGEAAREAAAQRSWNAVFATVYERYAEAFATGALHSSGLNAARQQAA